MLLSHNVFPEQIIPFSAPDAKEYGSSEAVIKAAIVDGFPHFEARLGDWLAEARANDWDSGKPGDIACFWGLQRIYREIANGEDIAIAMVDDFILPARMNVLNEMVSAVEKKLKIIQLAHWENINLIAEGEPVRYMSWYPSPHPKDSRISMGIASAGDVGLILSPEGAATLLKWCADRYEERCRWPVEMAMWFNAKTTAHLTGYYALNDTHPEFQHSPRYRIDLEKFTGLPDSDIR
jgi:hypothetical protein